MALTIQFIDDVVGREAVRAGLETIDRELVSSGQLWFANVATESVILLLQIRKLGAAPEWEKLTAEVRADGERFYRYRFVYRPLEVVEPDENVPRLIIEAVSSVLRLDDAGPWVTWTTNEWRTLRPPRDSHEWVRVVKTVSELLRVKFVDNERGGWRVSKAEDPPRAGTAEPVDRTNELRDKLRTRGKAVE